MENMKRIKWIAVLLMLVGFAGCKDDAKYIVHPILGNSYWCSVDGNGLDAQPDADFIVGPDGADFEYQDGVGYLNWAWVFYVKGEKIASGTAEFGRSIDLGGMATIYFEAKDEAYKKTYMEFPEGLEKPYRYINISIPANPTVHVREFVLEMIPVPDKNYMIVPSQFKFTQLAGY